MRRLWDPQIKILNIEGDLDEDMNWLRVVAEEPGYVNPVMFYRRRMRGKFKETLELKDFPVDIQVRFIGKKITFWCFGSILLIHFR